MNRIVRENYPVADLPEDLREGFALIDEVRIIVEPALPKPEKVLTIDELWALRRPPYKTPEERAAFIKQQAEQRMAERLAALGIKAPSKPGETAAQRMERERAERAAKLRQAEEEDARREAERQARLAEEQGVPPPAPQAQAPATEDKKPPPPPSRKAGRTEDTAGLVVNPALPRHPGVGRGPATVRRPGAYSPRSS